MVDAAAGDGADARRRRRRGGGRRAPEHRSRARPRRHSSEGAAHVARRIRPRNATAADLAPHARRVGLARRGGSHSGVHPVASFAHLRAQPVAMPCVDFQTSVHQKRLFVKNVPLPFRRAEGPVGLLDLAQEHLRRRLVRVVGRELEAAPHRRLAHHVLDDRRKRASVAVAIAADGRARWRDDHASDELRPRLRRELRELLPRLQAAHRRLRGRGRRLPPKPGRLVQRLRTRT